VPYTAETLRGRECCGWECWSPAQSHRHWHSFPLPRLVSQPSDAIVEASTDALLSDSNWQSDFNSIVGALGATPRLMQ